MKNFNNLQLKGRMSNFLQTGEKNLSIASKINLAVFWADQCWWSKWQGCLKPVKEPGFNLTYNIIISPSWFLITQFKNGPLVIN